MSAFDPKRTSNRTRLVTRAYCWSCGRFSTRCKDRKLRETRAEGKREQIWKRVARHQPSGHAVHIVDNSKTVLGIGEIAARIE